MCCARVTTRMKTLGVLMIVVLAGCASKPTLTELEEQALATGDWTEVEAREKGMSRLRRSTEQECVRMGRPKSALIMVVRRIASAGVEGEEPVCLKNEICLTRPRIPHSSAEISRQRR